MIIEQKQTTVIRAEEGKTLVRKSDGVHVGTSRHLGYDYYDAGMLREAPKLMTPDDFEEVDAEPIEAAPVSPLPRLKQMLSVIARERLRFNDLALSAEEAVQVADLAPRWGKEIGREGEEVKAGMRFLYCDQLHEVLADHTVLPHYYPNANTEKLYKEL